MVRGGVVVMQKLWDFLISLSLMKIFTWNSDKLFTIKRGTHTTWAGNSQLFFFWHCYALFLDIEFSKSSCSRALAVHAVLLCHDYFGKQEQHRITFWPVHRCCCWFCLKSTVYTHCIDLSFSEMKKTCWIIKTYCDETYIMTLSPQHQCCLLIKVWLWPTFHALLNIAKFSFTHCIKLLFTDS